MLRHDPPSAPPVVKGVTGQFLDVGIEEAVLRRQGGGRRRRRGRPRRRTSPARAWRPASTMRSSCTSLPCSSETACAFSRRRGRAIGSTHLVGGRRADDGAALRGGKGKTSDRSLRGRRPGHAAADEPRKDDGGDLLFEAYSDPAVLALLALAPASHHRRHAAPHRGEHRRRARVRHRRRRRPRDRSFDARCCARAPAGHDRGFQRTGRTTSIPRLETRCAKSSANRWTCSLACCSKRSTSTISAIST